MLQVKRLSGAIDRIPITVPGKLLAQDGLPTDQLLMIGGQVRSYNKVVENAGRLMVTLFAQSISFGCDNDTLKPRGTGRRAVQAAGVPLHAVWPEICDMMLAVNRAFGKFGLYSLHRLGPERAIRLALSRWATACASAGGCNRVNTRS